MAELPTGFDAHLRSGLTTLCRAWEVIRKDGQVLGFTDHDLPLSFKGLTFAPNSGMSASTLAQATGLSVDNAEAVGALSDASITEADIAAGRYDGYWERGLNIWDIAAGVIIAREAGAFVEGIATNEDPLTTGALITAPETMFPAFASIIRAG